MPSIAQIKSVPYMLRTAKKLTETFRESTGRALGDSGGAYGRNWEHNQKLEDWEAFAARPEASIVMSDSNYSCSHYGHEHEGDAMTGCSATIEGCVTTRECFCDHWSGREKEIDYVSIDGWHYIVDRFEYSRAWQKKYDRFVADSNESYLMDAINFAAKITGVEDEREARRTGAWKVWNTYNDDTLLNETFQMVTIPDAGGLGEDLHLVSYHGGCDVRGGYTAPIALVGDDELWYQVADAELSCQKCEINIDIRGRDISMYDPETQEDEYLEGFNHCPRCGDAKDLQAYAPTH